MATPTEKGIDRFWHRAILPELTSELNRRKKIYSNAILDKPSLDEESLRWLYQKTAYLTVRRLPDNAPTIINYDITFGAPKMDIIYQTDPNNRNFRDVDPSFGRDVTTTSTTENASKDPHIYLAPPIEPLLQLYDPDKGFIRTILTRATIETYGEGLAFTQKFSIQFTVYDSDVLSSYLTNFMRPLTPIELMYGWSTEDSNSSNGTLRGTVTNFQFSANQDGSWNCSIEGFSNPQVGNGVELNSTFTNTALTTVTGNRNDFIPYLNDNTYVSPPPGPNGVDDPSKSGLFINNEGGLGSILTNLTENSSILFDNLERDPSDVMGYVKISPSNFQNLGQVTGYYIVSIPVIGQGVTPWFLTRGASDLLDRTESVRIQRTYLRLDSLIHIINCILSYNVRVQKDMPYRVVIDPSVSTFIGPHETILKSGPADFLKFAWSAQDVGIISFPYIPDFEGNFVNPNSTSNTRNYYIGSILIESSYALSEFLSLSNSIKTNQPANFYTFLNSIFKQLSIETGGMINASCVVTDTEIVVVDANSISQEVPKLPVTVIPAITANSICREAKIESSISNEILTTAAMAENSYTSIGRPSFTKGALLTENGVPITIQMWKMYSESEKSSIAAKTGKNLDFIESDLKRNYLKDPANVIELIKLLNWNYAGIDILNVEKNKDGQYLDDVINEPYPSSHIAYVMRLQELYRCIFQGAYQSVIEGDNSKYKLFFNLNSARYPISLTVKLDGIEGFRYGNPITTNWLPAGYNNENCFFTILKISHTIENNDWSTELETIYEPIQHV